MVISATLSAMESTPIIIQKKHIYISWKYEFTPPDPTLPEGTIILSRTRIENLMEVFQMPYVMNNCIPYPQLQFIATWWKHFKMLTEMDFLPIIAGFIVGIKVGFHAITSEMIKMYREWRATLSPEECPENLPINDKKYVEYQCKGCKQLCCTPSHYDNFEVIISCLSSQFCFACLEKGVQQGQLRALAKELGIQKGMGAQKGIDAQKGWGSLPALSLPALQAPPAAAPAAPRVEYIADAVNTYVTLLFAHKMEYGHTKNVPDIAAIIAMRPAGWTPIVTAEQMAKRTKRPPVEKHIPKEDNDGGYKLIPVRKILDLSPELPVYDCHPLMMRLDRVPQKLAGQESTGQE